MCTTHTSYYPIWIRLQNISNTNRREEYRRMWMEYLRSHYCLAILLYYPNLQIVVGVCGCCFPLGVPVFSLFRMKMGKRRVIPKINFRFVVSTKYIFCTWYSIPSLPTRTPSLPSRITRGTRNCGYPCTNITFRLH